jgi:hypothetical protein
MYPGSFCAGFRSVAFYYAESDHICTNSNISTSLPTFSYIKIYKPGPIGRQLHVLIKRMEYTLNDQDFP